jgi:hypothetical protein
MQVAHAVSVDLGPREPRCGLYEKSIYYFAALGTLAGCSNCTPREGRAPPMPAAIRVAEVPVGGYNAPLRLSSLHANLFGNAADLTFRRMLQRYDSTQLLPCAWANGFRFNICNHVLTLVSLRWCCVYTRPGLRSYSGLPVVCQEHRFIGACRPNRCAPYS